MTEPELTMETGSRFLMTAAEIYDTLSFNDPGALFNNEAPPPLAAFIVGGILSLLGIAMWIQRVNTLKAEMAAKDPPIILKGNSLIRACISCAIDSDDPFYVIVSYGGVSFLFLGGIQLDYQWTLFAMLLLYMISAVGEAVRVLLAFSSARSLADVVVTSDIMASQLRGASTQLKPSNVYEDIGRGKTIVSMVFVTQVILISFVCVDIAENDTTSCRDGTGGCPIGGTLGSWCFYVLGIFMACVFQLGPKTNFGQSEQNPAYWLQLLLATKKSDAKITWFDTVENKTMEQRLHVGDYRTWWRFFMSFLINGVGFHILVHALPIQVASQSSLTGVVFRAVGMMYLVDLDDTPGYTLTIVEKAPEKEEKEDDIQEKPTETESPTAAASQVAPIDASALGAEAEKIIEEARAKLAALASGQVPAPQTALTNHGLLAAGSLANAGEREDGDNMTNAVAAPAEPTGDEGATSRGLPLGDMMTSREVPTDSEAANKKKKEENDVETPADTAADDDGGDGGIVDC